MLRQSVWRSAKKKNSLGAKASKEPWRRWWDSNPRARLRTKRFRIVLVTTTSIHLHIKFFKAKNCQRKHARILCRKTARRGFLKMHNETQKTQCLCGIVREASFIYASVSSQPRYDHFDNPPYILNSKSGALTRRKIATL